MQLLIKCMKKEEIITLFQEYEQAACEVNQVECWSARDLQKLLGYSLWQNFTKVIAKAKEACENVGQNILDHFIDVNKKVELGSGAIREVDDIISPKSMLTTTQPFAKCSFNVASSPKTYHLQRM